jgi:hypothetical protein
MEPISAALGLIFLMIRKLIAIKARKMTAGRRK